MEQPMLSEAAGNSAGLTTLKVEENVSSTGLTLEEQNLMRALTAAMPEHVLATDAGNNLNTDSGQFVLDENTMRSLQQFIESHGLHTEEAAIEQLENATTPVKEATTLAEGIAQHYLPAQQKPRVETEEERKKRQERIREENRARKKRWREQNIERNKDNDLRCRVMKRANVIYGAQPSPEKTLYIENEFKKRQFKRKGRPLSPNGTNSDSEMYAALLNNPEFTNILMNLLAQKGLDSGDSETTAQLLELLKSNPEFLKGFLSSAQTSQEQNQTQEQPASTSMDQLQYSNTALDTLPGLDASQLFGPPEPVQLEMPAIEGPTAMEISVPEPVEVIPTQSPPPPVSTPPAPAPALAPPPPTPSPVTEVERPVEPPTSSIKQTPIPPPPPTFAAIPKLAPYITPSTMTIRPPYPPPPPQERVRALGFPPMMRQTR